MSAAMYARFAAGILRALSDRVAGGSFRSKITQAATRFVITVLTVLTLLPLTLQTGWAQAVSVLACVDFNSGYVSPANLIAAGGHVLSGYTWSVTSGSALPPGLALDNLTGVIHGNGNVASIPAPGTYDIPVTITDNTGATAQTSPFTFELFVPQVDRTNPNEACPVPDTFQVIGIHLPLAAIPSQDYAATLHVEGGDPRLGTGVPPYTWSLRSTNPDGTTSALPAGMVLDQSTGVVRGTPDASAAGQSFEFTIVVKDANSNFTPVARPNTPGAGGSTYVLDVCGGPIPCPPNLNLQFPPGPTLFSVSVAASPPAGGTVSGGGNFPSGSTQQVVATPNSGYSFVNWTENGSVVSASASYTFTLNANRSLVANFVSSAGTLQVSPASNMSSSGPVGGPFSPSSFNYQLSASAGTLGYNISGLPSWLSASSTSGTVNTSGTTVTFSLNSNANSLSGGTYTATISFTNTTNGQGNQSRTATLMVSTTPVLKVSPGTNIASSGVPGGPFSPSSFTYGLSTNTGTLTYSVTGVPNWLTPSSTSGSVNTTGSNVTFTVNANANSLALGTYSATITFNSSTGFGTQTRTATLTVQPGIVVMPVTDMNFSGPLHGPFGPSSVSYTVKSTSGSLAFAVNGVPSWLTPSATSGTATTAGTAITFSVNSNANNFLAGTYAKSVTFVNVTNGQGTQSRSANLSVVQPAIKLSDSGQGAGGSPAFGTSVAVSADGNTILVGAPNDGGCSPTPCGAALVFVRNGQTWQQQARLLANDAVGAAKTGTAVALSDDGNTALLGGPGDNSGAGAAWVFTRANGVWTQEGAKLVGSGASGPANQGQSTALSADGNTVLFGGPNDGSLAGAAWVFTRSNGAWTQQGSKLIVDTGHAFGGTSVALSADGSTALIGSPGSGLVSGTGAVTQFTRTNGTWAKSGSFFANSAIGAARQGQAVALSGDASIALSGGPNDNSSIGAAWVFQGGQQMKLLGNDAAGAPKQGTSAAVSRDGNTLLVGGPNDNVSGAVWVYTKATGAWSQNGGKLITPDPIGSASFGSSVATSKDGTTVVVGGSNDNSGAGAAWVFTLPRRGPSRVATHDFNGDGMSDILWRSNGGDVAMWLMNGGQIISGIGLGNIPLAWSVVGMGGFNTDGKSDILWRNTGGDVSLWLMNGGQITSGIGLGNVPTTWSIAGVGDFNGDGDGDILWRNSNGDVTIWLMQGGQIISGVGLGNVPNVWTVAAVGDFDGDGSSDILWRDAAGDTVIWFISGGQIVSSANIGQIPTAWSVAATGDFNGDGKADLLWRSTSGDVAIWLLNGPQIVTGAGLGNVPMAWSIAETGDFNGDGKSDILWRDSSGDTVIWFMNGANVASGTNIGVISTAWTVQGLNAN